jgi:hypothetical protein
LIFEAHPVAYIDKMLLQHEKLYKLESPDKDDIAFLHEYHAIECAEAGHPESSVWRPDDKGEHEYDLVSLSMRPDRDHFSIWFFNTFHPLYHKYIMSRFKVCYLSPGSVRRSMHAKAN